MVVLVDETDMIYSATTPTSGPAINRSLRPRDPSEPIGERGDTQQYVPPPDKVIQA